MQIKTFALAAAICASVTTAAPTASPLLQKRCGVNANEQSCTVSDLASYHDYDIIVGETYSAATCTNLYNTLKADFPALSSWTCEDVICNQYVSYFALTFPPTTSCIWGQHWLMWVQICDHVQDYDL
jgi:hypothetical protein